MDFWSCLFGPAVYKNFGKLLVQGHLQAGIVWARTASVHLTGNVYDATGQVDPVSPTINVSLERQAVNQFGLGGGINLRYPLSNHFFIQAYSDVLAAKAQVKNLAVKAKIGTLELSEQISDKRFIGVVNLGGGIGISF